MKNSTIKSLSSLFIVIYTSQFSLALDTLTRGQSLKDDGQTLLSSSSIFEFGFFTPGNSTYRYVGIWYHNISIPTVVWVANRETPLTNSNGSLNFTSDGNLVLLNDKGDFLWSTNISISRSPLMKAQIMDMGKIEVRSDDERVIWDSFDHPTDTFLPGMKLSLNRNTGEGTLIRSWKNPSDPSIGNYSLGLDPSGSGQLFIWEGEKPWWRSGQWDGTQFIGSAMRPLYLNGFRLDKDTTGELMNFTFTYINSSLVRFVMQWDGVENTSILVEETKGWKSVYVHPEKEWGTYGKCQKYGLCSDNGAPICACLKGFKPKFVDGWNNEDWSGGCVRTTQLQCELNNGTGINSNGEGDGFYKLEQVKFPDFAEWASVRNEDDCRRSCTRNCSCKAYSYVPRNIGCLMWATDLIDMYQFQDEGSGSALYIKLAGSDLSELGSKSRAWRTIVIIIASVLLLLITCILLLWKFKKRLRGWLRKDEKQKCSASSLYCNAGETLDFSGSTECGDGHEGNDGELPLFTYDIIANATNDFSSYNKLGEGGFGCVYKGTLLGGQEIAVKKLSRNSGQGHEEFKNEMILIAKLQHRNLVRLLGYCIQGEEKMLIYEYLPNKSLDAVLFDLTRRPSLDWNKRFSIIEGIARGLVYLHRDSRLRIIHRDIKASNILLDEDMNPKISDFGMARIFGSDQNQLNTNRVVGTLGYMSPEYAMEGLFSVKSDVYSFGILVLEIVSGMKNNSFRHVPDTVNIVGYAWKLWNEDRAVELIDRSIFDSCSVHQVVRCIQVGLLCVQDHANDRPNMSSVVFMLGSHNVALPMAKRPLFTIEQSRSDNETRMMGNMGDESYSVNDVTITQPLGR